MTYKLCGSFEFARWPEDTWMFLLLLVWFFAFAPSSDSWRIRPDLQRGRSLCTWSTCSTSWATSGPGHGDGATLDLQKHRHWWKPTTAADRWFKTILRAASSAWSRAVSVTEQSTWVNNLTESGQTQRFWSESIRTLFPQTVSGTYLSSVWSCRSLGLGCHDSILSVRHAAAAPGRRSAFWSWSAIAQNFLSVSSGHVAPVWICASFYCRQLNTHETPWREPTSDFVAVMNERKRFLSGRPLAGSGRLNRVYFPVLMSVQLI